MKRIYAVVIFAAAVLLAPIMQPGNAEAAYVSMVYNFAVSTYQRASLTPGSI